MSKLNLNQVFAAIERQILVGKTYMIIARGLREADPRLRAVAPTFFGLTSDGLLELAQMVVARIYDQTPGPVTIRMMLDQADTDVGSFAYGNRDEVSAAIHEARAKLLNLEPVLAVIAIRRNEWLAHLDPRTVGNPHALDEKASLSITDLDLAFKESEKILTNLTRLFDGTFGAIRFSADDDYKAVFRHIDRSQAAERKEFADSFEAQFRHPPPDV